MSDKSLRYETNYLLELSRFPEQFYPLVAGLTGRDAVYCNPGASLRSFVMSGANVLHEFLNVSPDVVDLVEECEKFCRDDNVFTVVNSAIMKQPYDIIEKISYETKDPSTTKEMMKRLVRLNKAADDSWSAVRASCASGEIDLFTHEGREYKQALFDLKTYAGELVEVLRKVRKP